MKSMNEPSEEQGTPAQQIFFKQLHHMISNEKNSGCIDWLPDGNGFLITTKQYFSDNILPPYFGKAKLSSFTRRLKRWGFLRISGGYQHNHFCRDMKFDDDVGLDSMHEANFGAPFVNAAPLPQTKRLFFFPSPLSSPIPQQHSVRGLSDVQILPAIMRAINRNKRRDAMMVSASSNQRGERGESMEAAHALTSLGLSQQESRASLPSTNLRNIGVGPSFGQLPNNDIIVSRNQAAIQDSFNWPPINNSHSMSMASRNQDLSTHEQLVNLRRHMASADYQIMSAQHNDNRDIMKQQLMPRYGQSAPRYESRGNEPRGQLDNPPHLATLLKMKEDLEESFSRINADFSKRGGKCNNNKNDRVPLPDDSQLQARSPYNRAA